MTVPQLDLDAGGWTTAANFYDALLARLEAPDWHGRSIDALIDSIIVGQINKVNPPYQIVVHNARQASMEARAALYEAFGFLAGEGALLEIERQRVSLTVTGTC